MSDKGKGRAVPPISDDEPDSDIEFFTISRKGPRRPISPPPLIESDPSEYDSGADDDVAVGGKGAKKKRKRKPPKTKPLSLPAWTQPDARLARRKSSDDRKRRGTRSASDAIMILSSDEDRGGVAKGKSRPKDKESLRQRWIAELTPPPEVSEERKKELAAILAKHMPIEPMPESDDGPGYEYAAPAVNELPGVPGNPEDKIMITVWMKVDPERREAGMSQIAIKAWEKKRMFKCSRREPIAILLKDLASRLEKLPSELVLVHKKNAILALSLSPMSLGMKGDTEIEGYEKHVWERLEREKKAARDEKLDRLFAGNEDPAVARSLSPRRSETPPAAPQQESIRLILRGDWGEAKIGAKSSHTVAQFASHYCKKFGKPGLAKRVKIQWDGEVQGGDTTVEDLGAENGDQLDVIVP